MKHWMIFTHESLDIFYFWNGETVRLVHAADHEDKQDWSWPSDPTDSEIRILNEVAATKRKTVFQTTKGGRRYTVKSRGVFEYTNTEANAGS